MGSNLGHWGPRSGEEGVHGGPLPGGSGPVPRLWPSPPRPSICPASQRADIYVVIWALWEGSSSWDMNLALHEGGQQSPQSLGRSLRCQLWVQPWHRTSGHPAWGRARWQL